MSLKIELPPMTREDVQAFRAQMGLSQVQLAQTLGLSRPAIEKWERPDSVVPGHWRLVFAALKAGLDPWGSELLP